MNERFFKDERCMAGITQLPVLLLSPWYAGRWTRLNRLEGESRNEISLRAAVSLSSWKIIVTRKRKTKQLYKRISFISILISLQRFPYSVSPWTPNVLRFSFTYSSKINLNPYIMHGRSNKLLQHLFFSDYKNIYIYMMKYV